MTQHPEPGASARLDWLTLSADLDAVFTAARRLSAVARLQAAEFGRMREVTDPRRIHEAWSDTNDVVAIAVVDLDTSVERLRSQAAAVVGVVLDASEKEA